MRFSRYVWDSVPNFTRFVIPISVALVVILRSPIVESATFEPHLASQPESTPEASEDAGQDGLEEPLFRQPLESDATASHDSEPGESQGRVVEPLPRQKPRTPLHSIEAFYSGDEMYWIIGGAEYFAAKLSLSGDQGQLNTTFTNLDSTRLSVAESGIPDGLYHYQLVVMDPGLQLADDLVAESQSDCMLFPDPHGGTQCYARPTNQPQNEQNLSATHLQLYDVSNHSVLRDTIVIDNGFIRQAPSEELQ